MAALTTDRQTQSREANIKSYPVAVVKIFKGGLVAVNTSGYAKAASNTAGENVVGVADETVDNTAGTAGAKLIRVLSGRAFRFVASSITQAMVGDVMWVVDDQTFDDVATNVKAGRLVDFVSTTEGWIYIPAGGLNTGLAAATYGATEQGILNNLLN